MNGFFGALGFGLFVAGLVILIDRTRIKLHERRISREFQERHDFEARNFIHIDGEGSWTEEEK